MKDAVTAHRPDTLPVRGRIHSLDALRGIAALAVVLFHYTFGYAYVVARHVTSPLLVATYGQLGVELFFVISGFVILQTLERCAGVRDFALSRFARLYPAFLASSLITLAVLFVVGFNPQKITALDAMLSFTMVSELFNKPPIDPSYWTLGYELLFYAMACIIYLVLGVRRLEVACLLWLVIGRLGSVAHHKLGFLTEGSYSHLFTLGMMIFLISQRRVTILTVITVLASVAMAFYLPPEMPSNLPSFASAALAFGFGFCVWAAAEGKLRFLGILPLLFLGDISYSLYLVHQIAGYALIQRLEGTGWSANLAIAATVAAAIVVAACLRYGIERPAQRAIKTIGRRRLGIRQHQSFPSAIADKPV